MISKRSKIIFMDRDGVINKDPGGWTKYSYVTNWKEFRFIPGALEALKLLNKAGMRVIVVSNQAGVNKGFFSKEKLDQITGKMKEEINSAGGKIEDVYYCMHKGEDNCNCRKPKAGNIEAAIKKYGVDPRKSYFIGDSSVDVMAGSSAELKTIFVLSGKTTLEEMNKLGCKPDYIFKDLLEVTRWLLAREKRKAARALDREKR